MTFLVYLNDDYGAGQTAFPRLGIDHKGTRGEAVYFVNAGNGRRGHAHTTRGQNSGRRREVDHFAVRPRPSSALIQ